MNPHDEYRFALRELRGIAGGILADGVVNPQEIYYLHVWLEMFRDIADTFPGSVLAAEVRAIVDDGVVTAEELERFRRLLDVFRDPASSTQSIAEILDAMPVDTLLSADRIRPLMAWALTHSTHNDADHVRSLLDAIHDVVRDMVLTVDEIERIRELAARVTDRPHQVSANT